jgi:uncharacterized membrane protein YqjE
MADYSTGVSILESARRIGTTVLDIAETRLALFSTDLQEAAYHVVQLILLGVVSVFFLGIGLLLVTLLIVTYYWETHRLMALSIGSGFFLATSIVIAATISSIARKHRNPFAATLGELAKDRENINAVP